MLNLNWRRGCQMDSNFSSQINQMCSDTSEIPFPGYELPWSHYFREQLVSSGTNVDWNLLKTCATQLRGSLTFEIPKVNETQFCSTSHWSEHARCGRLCGLQGSKCPKPRPHRCSVCSRQFARSDMLTRHQRLHSGYRPYLCSWCGLRFSRSDHLNTHVKASHLATSKSDVINSTRKKFVFSTEEKSQKKMSASNNFGNQDFEV